LKKTIVALVVIFALMVTLAFAQAKAPAAPEKGKAPAAGEKAPVAKEKAPVAKEKAPAAKEKPMVVKMDLKGIEKGAKGTFNVECFKDGKDNVTLKAEGLMPDKEYSVWAMVAGKKTYEGSFKADKKGAGMFEGKAIACVGKGWKEFGVALPKDGKVKNLDAKNLTEVLAGKIEPPAKKEEKKPEVKKPEAKKPEVKKPEVKKPEAKKPEEKKPETK
jgi:hypothetical protein